MLRKFRVKINEKEYLVELQELGTQPSPVDEQPVVTTKNKEFKQEVVQNQTSHESKFVKAPMPGTILDVFVKVNDRVSVDQPLVILEAMKMENEIVSPMDGIITAVSVTKNQVIDVGEVIVSIR